jgi:hypothetical protein
LSEGFKTTAVSKPYAHTHAQCACLRKEFTECSCVVETIKHDHKFALKKFDILKMSSAKTNLLTK